MPTPVATQTRQETPVVPEQETEAPCCVPSHGEDSLLAVEAEALAARFKALSDPNRLRILSIVSSSPDAETCVCDLSEPLNLGQPTVSHHLKIMVEAGLLNREKRGVWAYYSLVPGALDSLAATLIPKA
ncbi:ArsR/SmtB family transcription factor [Paeniglutamicibacter sulfureus]|uniref:ArsR family transcriptional regulator n=1 Tax=Paeniglutamicibacter sulfureus TaxID=43666 RepID=A0ABU2BJP5_9MICC|nr:metalloregulator ArsR/SmtB family transcription factor [Paeniglutamicibacter sulfureus]MDR7358877.1 ArsR family transcriptional regulator [Paeniglutamicibacter sulfureus]